MDFVGFKDKLDLYRSSSGEQLFKGLLLSKLKHRAKHNQMELELKNFLGLTF